MKIQSVFASTLALTLAISSANAMPFGNMLHLHPHATQKDARVSLTVYNPAETFREITVSGQTYTVLGHHTVEITAPAGTVVYAGCGIPLHKKGSALLEMNDKLNGTRVKLG